MCFLSLNASWLCFVICVWCLVRQSSFRLHLWHRSSRLPGSVCIIKPDEPCWCVRLVYSQCTRLLPSPDGLSLHLLCRSFIAVSDSLLSDYLKLRRLISPTNRRLVSFHVLNCYVVYCIKKFGWLFGCSCYLHCIFTLYHIFHTIESH